VAEVRDVTAVVACNDPLGAWEADQLNELLARAVAAARRGPAAKVTSGDRKTVAAAVAQGRKSRRG
jgi:hypothetical protein